MEVTSSLGRSSCLSEMEKRALPSLPDRVICEGHARCQVCKFHPLSKMPVPGYHRPFYAKELCFLLALLWAERKHGASCPGTKLPSPQRPENKQLESRLHTEATLGTARPSGWPCSRAWKTLPDKALQRGPPTTGGREPTRKALEAPWLGK